MNQFKVDFLNRGRALLHFVRTKMKNTISTASTFVARRVALMWAAFYRLRYRVGRWREQHGATTIILITIVMIAVSISVLPVLDRLFKNYAAERSNVELVRSVLATLGGALFGASAIVSSLVLFAMQVNIERLPHGLFRRISADPLLLTTFAAAFILSLGVLALALVPMPQFGALALYASIWATIVTLLLFLFSYQRSLALVNPAKQLHAVVRWCRKDIRMWVRRAERARPLLPLPEGNESPRSPSNGREPDLSKAAYLRLNDHWTDESAKGVAHAVSIARRYAEQGDYEVSRIALNSIGAIVQGYVSAKGDTFFAQHFLMENPLSSDGFLNDTLEHLRRLSNSASARGDEQLSEHVMTLLSGLVLVLCKIDYGAMGDSKTHAHLAAAHLSGVVEKLAPLQMADVMMHGLRMMGRSALALLASEGPNGVTTLTQKIGALSLIGIPNRNLQPVTITGVQELASASYNLLLCKNGDVAYAARDIRGTIKLLAEFILAAEDIGFPGTHSFLLAPYFSGTSSTALSPKISTLVQRLGESPADSKDAHTILDNLADWSHQIYNEERHLFQLAIQRQSRSVLDHIHWVTGISRSLLIGASAPACSDHVRAKLLKNADWLIATIDWIPKEEAAVTFVAGYQIEEELFDLSRVARQLEYFSTADRIDRLLLEWGMKAAAYRTGAIPLENSIYGVLTSRLLFEGAFHEFDPALELRSRLQAGAIDDAQMRKEVAEELRDTASNLGTQQHHYSRIYWAMREVDQTRLRQLLEEMATILSPLDAQ